MKAIGYIRRSKKSEERNVSLQDQEQKVRGYAESLGLILEESAIVRHDGVSGSSRARYEEIYQAVAKHEAKVVVIYHLDRLARDASGLMEHLRVLEKQGIEIHEYGRGRIEIDKPVDKFTIQVRAAVDELYRDTIIEKTKHALAYRRSRKQRYCLNSPFGWMLDAKALVPYQEEVNIIPELILWRKRGFGATRIRKELLRTGYKGRCSLPLIKKLTAIIDRTGTLDITI